MRHGTFGHLVNPAGKNANYHQRGGGAGGVDLPTPTAYYPFDANANDVCANPCNLTNFLAYTGATGKVNNARLFGSSQVASCPSSVSKFDPVGGAWTLAFWVYHETTTNHYAPGVFVNGNASDNSQPNAPRVGIWYITGSGVQANVDTGAKGGSYLATAPGTTSLPAATWYLLVARYAAGTLYVSVNNGTEGSVAVPALTFGTGFGRMLIRNYTSSNTRVDEVGWWKGIALNATYRTTLYNNGNGRTFNGTIWT